ncbi:MAG: Fe-S cluster assembly protein SufD [Alphaproteobacteria bacterium]
MTAAAKNNIMEFPKKSPYVPCDDDTYTACKLPKDVPDWLKEARVDAFKRFQKQGLPTPKLERFKYTNVAKYVGQWDGVLAEPKIQVESEYVSALVDKWDGENWIKELLAANPPGLEKYADTALWDLNTAYLHDGHVVDIPVGKIVDEPIHLKITGEDDSYSSQRFIVRVGDNAQATLIEDFGGNGEYWRNRVSQILLGKNARLHHIIIHKDSDHAAYTQFTHVQMDRDAHYDGFALNTGAAMMRHQIHADLNDVNGHASLNGLNLLKDKQHADTTILVNHRAAHCSSNQFYRNILDDSAHGVFQGKVHVFEDAQKTDGYQLSNTLLLTESAIMDTKPELEIYADDVQCSHGATTGQLDEEPLFYLRSRGLSEKQARFLLIQAFVGEVLDKVENEAMKERLEKDVITWLETQL